MRDLSRVFKSFPAEPVLFLQSSEVLGRHWLPPLFWVLSRAGFCFISVERGPVLGVFVRGLCVGPFFAADP